MSSSSAPRNQRASTVTNARNVHTCTHCGHSCACVHCVHVRSACMGNMGAIVHHACNGGHGTQCVRVVVRVNHIVGMIVCM